MHRSEEEKEVACCSENRALQKKGLPKLIMKDGKMFLEKILFTAIFLELGRMNGT